MREKLELADIEWDQQGQPHSRQFGDIYFYKSNTDKSAHNGLEESRYVFLQHNNLEQRWASLFETENNVSSNNFVIAETGFGTGLNFLATWQLWQQCRTKHLESHSNNSPTQLHFISVEKHPLTQGQLRQALSLWPELSPFANQLLDAYPRLLAPGYYTLRFPESNLTLSLLLSDAVTGFRQCLQSQHPHFQIPFGNGVDAWFLDGFAPRCNPQMWNNHLVELIAKLSHKSTSLATYTAVGEVKRLLSSVGFVIKKVAGFAHKREMIAASFNPPTKEVEPFKTSSHSSPYPVPWSVNFHKPVNKKSALIVGAGLAGCHTANALAQRGWQVTLIDSNSEVAAGASGNAQGIVYTKLSVDDDALAQFNLNALLTAEQCYQPFWQNNNNAGNQCGVLQLAYNEKEQLLWQRCKDYFSQQASEDSALFVNAKQASQLAGLDIPFNAIFFPRLGWINPKALCQTLIDHPLITFIPNTKIARLCKQDESWQAINTKDNIAATATCAIITSASQALSFEQTQHLPLKNIRGQVSYLDSSQYLAPLKTVVCGEAYITPPSSHGVTQSLGASFNLHHHDLDLRQQDHQSNLDNIKTLLPTTHNFFSSINPVTLAGRSGFRCATPDYLPVVGPVHQHQQYLQDFAYLRKNAKANIHRPGSSYPGLYINVGHGSRGLAYTPLSAQLLAAQINGEPLPLSQSLAQALHPGRFTIRGLIRRQL